MGRREETTAQIRSAAVEEFALIGPRAFSLQGVATRAYVSIGAVYERWPNAQACIDDLVSHDLSPRVDDVVDSWRKPEASLLMLVRRDLSDPLLLSDLRFIIECVFAARDTPEFAAHVRSEVDRLGGTIAERIDVDADHETVGWWIASTWLANAILRTSGCPIPEPFADDVARLLALLGSARGERSKAASVVPGTLPMPSTSPRAAHDDTAEALVQAAAQIMATDGVHEADTRRIASEAGMTTGALYRRFRGRSELLADVLKSQLTPERYAWAEEFIQTLDHPDDLDAGARYLAALTARTWTEDQGAQLLLEITVAAHTDEELRTGIMQEITKVADAREEMLRQFIELGLVRTGLSASTLAWLLQVPPIGMRILASIGMIPNEAGLTRLMRAYLAFLMTDNDSSV